MRTSLLCTAALAVSLLAIPASSSAAGWNCSATVVTGTPAGAPIAANAGASTCRAASAGGNLPALPLPLTASALSARTTLDGPAGEPAAQRAGAVAQVTGFGLAVPSDVPIALPATSLNVPGIGVVDITSALRALVPLPTGPIVGVATARASATGECSSGTPRLAGTTQTTGLTVAGLGLPTDQVVDRALDLVNGGTIDPSMLTPGLLPPPLNGLPLALLQPLLDALPDIAVPATVADVRVSPGSQSVDGGTLTQRGPRVTVTVAGQTLVDVTLGEASVSRGDVACGHPVAQAQLACTTRKLALIDVLDRSGYTRLYGVADRKYVGRRVSLVSLWNGKTVARPMVQRDGTFLAKGKLPPTALRKGNRARYQARIGNERSLRLKLFRRMVVSRMSSSEGKVTIAGRVVGPLGHPAKPITIKRRVSCTKNVTVKKVAPDRSGRFSVTIAAPTSGQAAVYRLQTSVRKHASNPKLFATFTLPRAVELKR
jgi:hypothetical protein